VDRPSGVALHPARTIELPVHAGRAFDLCTEIVRNDLGGHLMLSDPPHAIEAAFGLINSERLAIAIEPAGDSSCRVTLQSRRIAAPQSFTASQYVDTLASKLESHGK
jgi:hypothetical protein